MEGWEILLRTCASECAPSRRLDTQAMDGGIRVCSKLIPALCRYDRN